MTEAVRKVMAARVLAQSRWPYISHLLFSLRLVPISDQSIETLGVDAGWRLYFNQEFVETLTVPDLATFLQHEAMHCMLSHHERFTSLRDPEPDHLLFNIAGDCGINHVIEESGFDFPKEFTPVRYKNYPKINKAMTTERAYFTLKEEAEKYGGGGEGKPEPSDCGSVAGGAPREYELLPNDQDVPAASQELKVSVKSQVASEISKSAGSAPSGLLRWAEDFLSPKVDWRRQLAVRVRAAMATKAGRRDYSMMRPSRREQGVSSDQTQIRLPAMRQPGDPRVAVVVDTSGSITNEVLMITLSEVMAITRAVGNSVGVQVIPCDAVAYPSTRVRTVGDVRSLKLPGGGGTDMREGIKAALQAKLRPDAIVVVTDGETPWPSAMPAGCENFIVLLTTDSTAKRVPSWAKQIVVDLNGD